MSDEELAKRANDFEEKYGYSPDYGYDVEITVFNKEEDMNYYRLKKDLPTFKAGELFYTDDNGSLIRESDELLVYHYSTMKKFPNILEDWFEPAPQPIRDIRTRTAFETYLQLHPDERFFQAVRNFTREYLDNNVGYILAEKVPSRFNEDDGKIYEEADGEDTFYWECDGMLSSGLSIKDIEHEA